MMVASANETAKTYKIHAIRNTIVSDTCFLKVIGKTLLSKVKGIRAVAYVFSLLRSTYIHAIRFVAYGSYSGICDRVNTMVNTRKKVRFQISPSTND